jgi:Zinc finger, C3HC4 type (RING finger)
MISNVCLEIPMINPIMLEECHHKYCSLCLLQWQKHSKLEVKVGDSQSHDASPVKLTCPNCPTETKQDIEVDMLESALELSINRKDQV